jgi:hypothetical protein
VRTSWGTILVVAFFIEEEFSMRFTQRLRAHINRRAQGFEAGYRR